MTPEAVFFEEKILIHYRYLEKYLKTLRLNQALVEDILQETMAVAWEKVHMMQGYKNVRRALKTTATNILINHIRSKTNQELSDDDIVNRNLPQEKDNLLILLDEEDKRTVLDAIGKLNEPCVNIILLRYYYNLPFTKIALLLDMNYNTVLSHHRRSVAKLKELLSSSR